MISMTAASNKGPGRRFTRRSQEAGRCGGPKMPPSPSQNDKGSVEQLSEDVDWYKAPVLGVMAVRGGALGQGRTPAPMARQLDPGSGPSPVKERWAHGPAWKLNRRQGSWLEPASAKAFQARFCL